MKSVRPIKAIVVGLLMTTVVLQLEAQICPSIKVLSAEIAERNFAKQSGS